MSKRYTTILTIAGSDPIGGAGIQADIKTAQALDVYAMTVVTAVTAQNSSGVKGVMPVTPELVRRQLQCVMEDQCPDAVKIGMVPNGEVAEIIAEFLEKNHFRNVIVDPVMVASSGHNLASLGMIDVLKNRIFPLASLVTPNIPEAEKITSCTIKSHDDSIKAAAKIMNEYGSNAILIKGGHRPERELMSDLFVSNIHDTIYTHLFTHPVVKTRNTHGTGCTLSTSIASFLAHGYDLERAVESGIDYLQKVLIAAREYEWGGGKENGPMKHLDPVS